MKEKAFYKILTEIFFSAKKTKRSLSDLRLTKTEKLIIEGYLDMRRNLNQEAFDSISSTVPSELPFVEAQRQLILGSVLTNLSRFIEAEKHLYQSLKILQTLDSPFFLFCVHQTLFVTYDNLNETKLMHRCLEEMKKYTTNKRHQAKLLICEFCYEQKIENYREAKNLLKEIDLLSKDLAEVDITNHLLNKFMFFVQVEDLVTAKSVLIELKKCRNYQLSENYNFMKKMLDHLTENAPLYVYDHQFEGLPPLLHQLKVIQALEEKKLDVAQRHWEILKTFSLKTYGDNFQYHGPTCLFSLALKKHPIEQAYPIQLLTLKGESKIDDLVSILTEAASPVPAALIYEVIWGSPAETKDDLVKVAKLVSRTKAEKNLVIEFRKGTYLLIHKDLASKVS